MRGPGRTKDRGHRVQCLKTKKVQGAGAQRRALSLSWNKSVQNMEKTSLMGRWLRPAQVGNPGPQGPDNVFTRLEDKVKSFLRFGSASCARGLKSCGRLSCPCVRSKSGEPLAQLFIGKGSTDDHRHKL